LLGRYALGTTVDRLLRGAPAPLLIVEARAREPYRHIVVATDFSESARHAFETAVRFFPTRRLTLFHAFEPAMEGLVPDVSAYRREARAAAIADGVRFVAGASLPDGCPEPEFFVEYGEPARLLRNYVRAGDADLVVLGSHGRSAIFEIFIGSVAKRILDRLPCDALLVREPRAASDGA
jgi:nucleotide-binding universal stress UspA family protein